MLIMRYETCPKHRRCIHGRRLGSRCRRGLLGLLDQLLQSEQPPYLNRTHFYTTSVKKVGHDDRTSDIFIFHFPYFVRLSAAPSASGEVPPEPAAPAEELLRQVLPQGVLPLHPQKMLAELPPVDAPGAPQRRKLPPQPPHGVDEDLCGAGGKWLS